MINFPKWRPKQAWRESDAVAGVCLTELGVSVAVMAEHAGRVHLLDAVYVPCVDVMAHGKVLDQAKLSQALIHAISQLSVPVHQAIGCVHDDAAMSTVIELAGCLDDDEVEVAILMDAERYIAQSLENVCFDFVVLSRLPTLTTVRLVVAHKQAVDDCLEILAAAGLDAKGVSIYADVMLRAMPLLADADDVAMLDIGYQQTQLFVYQQGQFSHRQTYLFGVSELETDILCAHDASSGAPSDLSSKPKMSTDTPSEQGLDFYQFLMQHQENQTNQPLHQARISDSLDADVPRLSVDTPHLILETSADKNGLDDYQLVFDDDLTTRNMPSEQAANAHQDYQPLVERLVSALQAYQAHHEHLPRRVLIAGLSADEWVGLDDQLTNALGVAWSNSQVSFATTDIQKLDSCYPADSTLLAAMALSLSPTGMVNLLPWRAWQRELATRQFYRQFAWLMVVLLTALACIVGYLMYQTHRQQAINQAIMQRIDGSQAKIREKQHLEQQLAQSKEQLMAIDGVHSWQVLIYRWQHLVNLIPSGVYLDSVQQQGDMTTLMGMALSADKVASLTASLEASGLYTDVLVVSLQSVNAQAGTKAQGAMSYTITARLLDVDTALLNTNTEQVANSPNSSDITQMPSAQSANQLSTQQATIGTPAKDETNE